MDWIKNKKHRFCIAILAALAAMVLPCGGSAGQQPDKFKVREETGQPALMEQQPPVLAWWGTLYPKFCFADIPDSDREAPDSEKPKIKITFWLARFL